jgi:hypothetical protein
MRPLILFLPLKLAQWAMFSGIALFTLIILLSLVGVILNKRSS